MVTLVWQSIFRRLAGYEDTNDAERLSVDPTMRFEVGGRGRLPEESKLTAKGGFFEGVAVFSRIFVDFLLAWSLEGRYCQGKDKAAAYGFNHQSSSPVTGARARPATFPL